MPPYIANALAALRFNRSVLVSGFHSDEDELIETISEAIADGNYCDAPEIYFALQGCVDFWEEKGCVEASETMAFNKATAAMADFPTGSTNAFAI